MIEEKQRQTAGSRSMQLVAAVGVAAATDAGGGCMWAPIPRHHQRYWNMSCWAGASLQTLPTPTEAWCRNVSPRLDARVIVELDERERCNWLVLGMYDTGQKKTSEGKKTNGRQSIGGCLSGDTRKRVPQEETQSAHISQHSTWIQQNNRLILNIHDFFGKLVSE
jgi:hypothetical protein